MFSEPFYTYFWTVRTVLNFSSFRILILEFLFSILPVSFCLWKLVQCVLIARTRMQQLKQSQQLQQQSSPRVGALSLTPSCLGISGHPSGSRQGHPRYTGPWVVRTQFSTADHSVRNTPSMVAEQCRSRARALAKRALLTRVCCVTEDPETKKSMRRSTRNSMRKRKWSMRSRSPWRMEQEAPRRVPWRQAKTRLKRAISVEKLGLWTWWQIGDQTVPVFTEARSVAQVWQTPIIWFSWLMKLLRDRSSIPCSSFDGAEHKWWWNGCEKPSVAKKSLPWRKDVSDERVMLTKESWWRTQRVKAGNAWSRPLRGDDAC